MKVAAQTRAPAARLGVRSSSGARGRLGWIGVRSPILGLALLLAAPLARGAVVPDQVYSGVSLDTYGALSRPDTSFERAQTFTVGIAGRFHHAEIALGSPAAGSARLLATTGGLPNGTVLASTSLVSAGADGWTIFDFSSAGLKVSVGDVLALEPFAAPGTTPHWAESWDPLYPRGADCLRDPGAGSPDWSFDPPNTIHVSNWFRTYVDTGTTTPTLPTSWGRLKSLYR